MVLQETTTAAPLLTNISSDNGSDDGDIIYTPPSSTTSMSSSSSTSVDPAKSANISIRTYIYLLPYPLPPNTPVPYSIHLPSQNPLNLPTTLFEPTSTLVLTSPRNTFVDLRFLKPTTPSPNTPLVLDWGFAGQSSSSPIPSSTWKNASHSTWTHFVDSRHPAVSTQIPVDEGDMYPISETLTLEHGHAYHPHLHDVKSHEEMWRDEPILSTPTTSSTYTSTSTSHSTANICIVLRLQNDAKAARGVIVRLGQYVQGIMVVGTDVSAERWEFNGGQGEWMRSKRVGKGMLPCGVTMREEVLGVGGEIGFGEWKWGVEEVWAW
jgi:hypothetical protein